MGIKLKEDQVICAQPKNPSDGTETQSQVTLSLKLESNKDKSFSNINLPIQKYVTNNEKEFIF